MDWEYRLNQLWVSATTSWYWSERIVTPAYQVNSNLPETILARFPLADGDYLDISMVEGAGRYGTTGFAAPVNDRLVAFWSGLKGEAAVLPAANPVTAYWQPGNKGYKPLVYLSQKTLLVDGAFQAATAARHWQSIPWLGLQYEDSWQATDWRSGVLVLDFLLPEAQRHALPSGRGDLPELATDHPLALQWLAEYSALKNELLLVTPLWLSFLAVLALLLPWWLPRELNRQPSLMLGFLVFWLASNLLLMMLFQWWLPLWPILLSISLALWLSLKQQRSSRFWRELLGDYRALAGERLSHLLQQGQVEEAQKLLMTKPWLADDVAGLYRVARAFERKRQYQAALDCYQWIMQQDSNFEDVDERQRALIGLADPKTTFTADATQRTVLAPAGLEQPEIGRYRLLGELGRGAMGTVYKAIDPRIERTIALKVVNLDTLSTDAMEEVKERFYREAKAAGRLDHPNIVTVFDVGEEQGLAYIAMDLIDGISLQQRLMQDQKVKVSEVCEWLAQAADALDYAHAHGVIHRDIKPANLLLDELSGRLKVSDFGVARLVGSEQTGTGIILGSPTYMSPEQIGGEPLTPQADIYSLGVSLYRALAGRLPFQGDSLPSLAYAILHEQAKSPRQFNPDVSPALVRIVNRAMQKNPADRYATAGQMAQALRRRLTAD